MYHKIIITSLCFALPAMAETISISATCSLTGQTVTDPTGNCSLKDGPQANPWIAVSTFSYSTSSTPTSFTFNAAGQLNDDLKFTAPAGYLGQSSLSVEYKTPLLTSGATRPGFLVYAASGGGSKSEQAFGGISASFGLTHSVTLALLPTNSPICSISGQGTFLVGCSQMFPITLGDGNPLLFDFLIEAGSFSVIASDYFSHTGVTLGAQVTMYAVEADGITRAALTASATPEPNTATILLVALGVIAAWKKRQRVAA